MTRCVVISEIPVSYREGWFRHVHASSSVDLHVVYLAGGQPDRPWEDGGTPQPWISHQRTFTLGGTARGYFPRMAVRLGRTLRELRPDVVVIPGWAHPVCWQAVLWCRRHKVPYGVTFESWKTQSQTSASRSFTARARQWVLRHSAVALPAGLRAEQFAHSLGIDPVVVVHANTCDSATIAEATADVTRHAEPTVLYVGRLMQHKGADLVAALAPRLGAQGVQMRIIGDGPLRPEVEAMVAANPQVQFLGPQAPDVVRREMAQAWAVVVPSREEPWGVVVQEALAAGTPVVATTEVGSGTDLITSDAVGAVVPPDLDALHGACLAVVQRASAGTAAQCREAALSISYATAARELEHALAVALGMIVAA